MRIILLLAAVILGMIGTRTVARNGISGIAMVIVAVALLIASLYRKRKPNIRVAISPKFPFGTASRTSSKQNQNLPAIGSVDPICPYCERPLEKKPSRKKKCFNCGEFIFVRTRPSDGQQVLVTKAQTEEIEEQWSIVNGTHDAYLAEKKQFAKEKARLTKRFGREPSNNDVRWSQLNQKLIEHAGQQNWGLFRNAKFEMAEILRKESKLEDALAMYLEVCYLDLNGPNNVGGITDQELLKQFPPWNPKDDSFLAPGVIGRIVSIIEKTTINNATVRKLFDIRTVALRQSLRLPVSVDKAWQKIESALFS
jgi:DNA-directed RNA polymerase subunit RPC12/RpoP